MGPCLSPELCSNVFRVVQAAARPEQQGGGGNGALGPSGLAAIQVVTAILDKKLVPKQLEVRSHLRGASRHDPDHPPRSR